MMCRRFAVLLLVSTLAACAGAGDRDEVSPPPEAPPTGSVYQAPGGAFEVVVPDLLRPGSRMFEQGSPAAGDAAAPARAAVVFTDELGRLLRVEAMTPDADPAAVFDRLVLPALRGPSPAASVALRERRASPRGPVLFAVVHMPGASTVFDPATGRRADALRGVLVFNEAGRTVILMTQEWPPEDAANAGALPPRAELLWRDLVEALGAVTVK